jgi:peptidoglycan hydrolase-like protein with peptidoglycan-binding domain
MKHRYTTLAAAICLALTPAAFAGGDKAGDKAGGYQGSPGMSQSQGTQASPGMSQSQGTQAQPDVSSSASTSLSSETIRQVQQELTDKGHNPGPVDGVLGPQTKSALKDFQQAQGMSASGNLDRQTIAALGIDSSTGGATSRSSQGNEASPGSTGSGSSVSPGATSPGTAPGTGSTGNTPTAPRN